MLLVLLDLSAAFDTIDHDVLLKRLNKRCGIKGSALKWFKSYLKDRKQSVIIESELSETVDIPLRCSTRINTWTNHIYHIYVTTRGHTN